MLLAALLALPTGDRYAPLTLSPQRHKERTIEALVDQCVGLSRRQPVVCIFEDAHWSDPTSLELLDLLVYRVPTMRVLVVITHRPGFAPRWGDYAHVTTHTLTRLTRREVAALVAAMTGGKTLPPAVLDHLVARTDGVPLFVEELTKAILESGLLQECEARYELPGPLPPLAIPATLHDSLVARLDRLGTARELAQLAATLGREFSYELLGAVSHLDAAALQDALAQLVNAGLLFQGGTPPAASYLFKHALVQDAAYASLLKRMRMQYHERIARVLEARFPETVETQPELMAHHCTEAGLRAKAVVYWQQAGQRTIAQSAYVEAISHLSKGLEVLHALPDTPERTQQELDLQMTLGPALMALKGWSAPEVAHAYARAQALCQQVGQTPQLFHVRGGLWAFYLVRGELQTAQKLAEQCATFAQSLHEPAFLLLAQTMLGMSLLYRGELPPASASLEDALARYDPSQHHHLTAFGADPGALCLTHVAQALFFLGYPEQAVQRASEAIALAQQLSHPFSLGPALSVSTWIHWWRGEIPLAQQQAEAMITLSTEQGFPHWLAQGMILRGCALVAQDQGEEGIAHIRQGIASHRTTGAILVWPLYLALLAEAYGKVGQAEAGFPVLDEALTVMNKSDERVWEAELYRIKGELLLQTEGDRQKAALTAERCLQQALTVARRQQARSWELRAAISLSHLWQRQGKDAEARKLLVPICGWFTEGFDTVDLQEAKVLLDELK